MKRPTQANVPRLAGLSGVTVSPVVNKQIDNRRLLSEGNRLRVLEAVYVPDARTLEPLSTSRISSKTIRSFGNINKLQLPNLLIAGKAAALVYDAGKVQKRRIK